MPSKKTAAKTPKKFPSQYHAQEHTPGSARSKKPERAVVPTAAVMFHMSVELRNQLGSASRVLGVTMKSLVEEGVKLVLEKKAKALNKG